jgi:hypothetical protein
MCDPRHLAALHAAKRACNFYYTRNLHAARARIVAHHPDTLSTINTVNNVNIAAILEEQGEYKALEWYQRALDGYEKTLGKDHPDTLGTVHDITSDRIQQARRS